MIIELIIIYQAFGASSMGDMLDNLETHGWVDA